MEADVSSSAALSAAFERHVARWGVGTLRACVNNAGVGDGAGAEAVVGVNLLSHFAAAALCERHMADGGAIVNGAFDAARCQALWQMALRRAKMSKSPCLQHRRGAGWWRSVQRLVHISGFRLDSFLRTMI